MYFYGFFQTAEGGLKQFTWGNFVPALLGWNLSHVIDDDMLVDPSDVTQSSKDCPYKAGVFPN